MITVKNRRMIVPPEEKFLGVETDTNSSIRVFRIPRYITHEIDLSSLAFFLDIRYEDNTTNETAFIDMLVSDNSIDLTWYITANDLGSEGAIFLQLKANDLSGKVKWKSFIEPFFVGDCIDAAGQYTGDLSAYEALVTRCVIIENREVARMAAEELRQTNTTNAINNANAATQGAIVATSGAIIATDRAEHAAEVVEGIVAEKTGINDNTVSLSEGWSSSKINSELAEKAKQSDVESQFKSTGINIKYPPAPISKPAYDGVTVDDVTVLACVQLALESGLPLYFPTGRIKLTIAGKIILNKAIRVYGDGRGLSTIVTDDNDMQFITYDCSAIDMYFPSVHDIGFENYGVTPSSVSCAIRIIDNGNNHYFNFANIYNIYSAGCYDAVRSEKQANSGAENMINFGTYKNIVCTNSGANQTKRGVYFMHGSGTGNIFTENYFISELAGIEIGQGVGTINVGDIIITDTQFAVASRGIKLNGSLSAYTSNVTISNCQFDAGVDKAYELINMNGFTIQGCIGTEDAILTNCNSYSIQNHGSRRSEYSVEDLNMAVSEVRPVCKIKLPLNYQNGVLVKIFSTGLVQGIGIAVTVSEFIIMLNGGAPAAGFEISTVQKGAGIITHTFGVSGQEIVFNVLTNGTADNSSLKTNIEVVGYDYELTLLDHFN